MLIVGSVSHLVLTKRHVPNCHIKEIIGIVCLFKACDLHIGIRVKLPCDSSGNSVQLHTIKPALLHILRQHTEKVADTHCRLQDVAFGKAHSFHRIINRLDDNRACVVGI